MIDLPQPVDPFNPIVFLDIQIGLENGKILLFNSVRTIFIHNAK